MAKPTTIEDVMEVVWKSFTAPNAREYNPYAAIETYAAGQVAAALVTEREKFDKTLEADRSIRKKMVAEQVAKVSAELDAAYLEMRKLRPRGDVR